MEFFNTLRSGNKNSRLTPFWLRPFLSRTPFTIFWHRRFYSDRNLGKFKKEIGAGVRPNQIGNWKNHLWKVTYNIINGSEKQSGLEIGCIDLQIWTVDWMHLIISSNLHRNLGLGGTHFNAFVLNKRRV